MPPVPDTTEPATSDTPSGIETANPAGTGEATRAESEPTETTADPKPTGFGALAHTIRRRTSDFLAIGILAVAGLGFGARLSNWWSADDEAAQSIAARPSSETHWDEPGRPVEVLFGDSPIAMHRERFDGTLEEATDRLVGRTRELLESAVTPTEPANESELELREAALRIPPELVSPDGLRAIHVAHLPLPTTTGFVTAEQGEKRVVCWGMLLGGPEAGWTAFWFQRTDGPTGGSDGLVVVLPEGAEHTLTLRDALGTTVSTFHGRGPLAEWRTFLDAHWRRLGATAPTETANAPGTWAARYRIETGDGGRTVDVRLTDGPDGVEGLVMIEPDERGTR